MQKLRELGRINFGLTDSDVTNAIKTPARADHVRRRARSAGRSGRYDGHPRRRRVCSSRCSACSSSSTRGSRSGRWLVRLFPRRARDKADSSGRKAWVSLTAFVRATIIVAAVDSIGISLRCGDSRSAAGERDRHPGVRRRVRTGGRCAGQRHRRRPGRVGCQGPHRRDHHAGRGDRRTAARGARPAAVPARPRGQRAPARRSSSRSPPASSSPASSAPWSPSRPPPSSTPSSTTWPATTSTPNPPDTTPTPQTPTPHHPSPGRRLTPPLTHPATLSAEGRGHAAGAVVFQGVEGGYEFAFLVGEVGFEEGGYGVQLGAALGRVEVGEVL